MSHLPLPSQSGQSRLVDFTAGFFSVACILQQAQMKFIELDEVWVIATDKKEIKERTIEMQQNPEYVTVFFW